jgi:hypothetical protein
MEEKEEKENTRVSVTKLLEEISTLNVTHLPSFSGQQKPCLYLLSAEQRAKDVDTPKLE